MSLLREFIKKIPFVKTTYHKSRKLFRRFMSDRTQAGELTAIKKIIKEDYPPFLADIGAHDGTSISNSAYFIEKGWKGILIEPMPEPFEKLSEKYRNNHNVKCVNIACSNRKGVEDFFVGSDGPNGMLGSLCKDNNEWFESVRSEKSIKVKVDTITNQLMESEFPKDFSLLFIDAEGMDYEVLLGLDFNLFSPRIIVTEEYKWNREKHDHKYKLLEDNGYKLLRLIGCNTIWVRE